MLDRSYCTNVSGIESNTWRITNTAGGIHATAELFANLHGTHCNPSRPEQLTLRGDSRG